MSEEMKTRMEKLDNLLNELGELIPQIREHYQRQMSIQPERRVPKHHDAYDLFRETSEDEQILLRFIIENPGSDMRSIFAHYNSITSKQKDISTTYAECDALEKRGYLASQSTHARKRWYATPDGRDALGWIEKVWAEIGKVPPYNREPKS